MKTPTIITTIIAAVLTLGACAKQPTSLPRSDAPGGIVHGHAASANREAAQSVVALVSVNSEGQALCTGTLIGKDTVLTAAHCVDGDPQRLIVAFGAKLKEVALEDRREVDGFIQHPRWRQPTSEGRGDIALVHFKGKLPKEFHPVHLAAKRTTLGEGTTTLMLGYGVTNGDTEKGAGVLRETKTKILKNYSVTEIMSDGKSSSVCFGDSGGPAFLKIEDRYVQWGVASSVANQSCNQYSVHTSVIPYKAWIKTATQQLRQGSK